MSTIAKEDLIPMNKRTKEEQKAIARKGGIASGIARRKRKDRYELAQAMINASLNEKNKNKVKALIPNIEDEDLTVNALMITGMIKSAINGNVKAFEVLNAMPSEEKDRTLEKLDEVLNKIGGKI